MARPRVFISSTFYDLRYVRADLEAFVRDMGYDPVLHERGAVPYGSDKALEEYCYREVERCDILVSIIGGRYGSPSRDDEHSISENELRRAVKAGKQIYIFISRPVHAEYQTYLINKSNEKVKYKHVDDAKVYQFIEAVEALPVGNPIAQFDDAQEITGFLREQWAGLFQGFLEVKSQEPLTSALRNIEETAKTLDQLVTFLTEDKKQTGDMIHSILLDTHPIFAQLKSLLRVQYRVFFTTRTELNFWLKARQFEEEGPVTDECGEVVTEEWVNSTGYGKKLGILGVNPRIWDEKGNLRVYTPEEWDPEYVTFRTADRPKTVPGDFRDIDFGGDDIPF